MDVLTASPTVTVAITADPTVNYAVQQNAVSIIKRLRVTNAGTLDLDRIHIVITTEPACAHPWEHTLDRLPAGATADLGVVDLDLYHDFLAHQSEAVRGSIIVTVRQGEQIIAEHRQPIDVLAYDEWNGVRTIPEMLAAFVMPNHPDVERLLAQAGQILKEWTGDPSFQGYQAKDVERVRRQTAAIYATIRQQNIVYCGVPASFEQQGQKVRTPDRILSTRLGNCLDLSTLFAACLEQAGLRPVVCVLDGHAFPGVWLIEESFADSVVDDALMLRKRIDLGEICVFEATLAVDGGPMDLAAAIAEGRRHFDESGRFLFAVDIRRARMSRIRPLPVRTTTTDGEVARVQSVPMPAPASTSAPVSVAAAPVATALPEADAKPLTPADRLDRWKRKLLDLSLRNRLLNFTETKSAVPLLIPDLPSLENALAEGKQLEVHPRPHDWDSSDRDSEVHRRRTGEDAANALLHDEFTHRRLRCGLEAPEVSRRLTEIYRSARSSLEENGANTLYLALGMLVWYETKTSPQPRRAPILLIPIEIQRQSAQSGFTIRRRDEESMINVTMLELLRHDYDLRIDGLDPLPEDDAGIDVRQVLDRIRQAIKHIDRWDVAEDAYVGLFSFTKFLMWRDLELRTADLKRNKLVSSLINFPAEPFPSATGFPDVDRMDDEFRPDETFTPVSADSSQLAAVHAAGAGKSFVLHGPPGTGKSQTITNIIAQTLAQGKTVLFVAEKMAALSVVQRRLDAVGLGPFCLELHSNKSKKADVLAQLDTSLKFGTVREPKDWQAQADRLAQTRSELNTYVRALHAPQQTGESYFDGLAKLIALGSGPRVTLDASLLTSVTAGGLERLRDKVRDLTAAGHAAGGQPAQHVWRAVRTSAWTPQLRDDVDAAIPGLLAAVESCVAAVRPTALLFGLPGDNWSLNELAALMKLAELILSRSSFATALVSTGDWEEANAAVERWITQGRERDRLRGESFQRYTDRILALNPDDLAAQRATSAHSWFLPRWLTQQRVLKALQTAAKPGYKVVPTEIDGDIEGARQLLQQEKVMTAAGDQARALLGRLWRDGEADWADLGGARDWADSIRRLAVQIAGEDVSRAQELRRRWAAVMTEHAELLRAGGIYATQLQRMVDAVGAVAAGRDALNGLLSLDQATCWGDAYTPRYLARTAETLTTWRNSSAQLRLWCAWMKERGDAIAMHLDPLVKGCEQGELETVQIDSAFERSFYNGWVDQVMSQEESLRRFSRQSLEERIARFRALDDQVAQLTRQEIQARLAARIPHFDREPSHGSEVGILRRELQKRTRHMALRQLFQQTRNLLPRLKPCLLMSPISVAQYLDPVFPPFDLIVFDEASQVPTWDAVGAIARGAETIIVGDPAQLPPTSFFAKADDADEEEVATEDLESILDDSLALTMPEMHLRWHYRSRHESLIAFSNYHYYHNGLISFPSPVDGSAVSLRYVKGEYDRSKSRTNRAEAEAVVQEVVRRLSTPATAGQSLGIVTFSMAQQRLVEDLLDEARRRNPALEPYFAGEQKEPVFVKNLENVQGDEREVILFSVCYGPDSQGHVSVHFGPLNRDGGERRLNVAITRARREVVVFSSVRPEQIDLSRTKAVGVHHLRSFLEYAQRGTTALQEQVRFRDGGEPSAFEQHVCDVLTARGHRVKQQVGCSEYRIDLAVEDPGAPGRFMLGIECDGRNYHQAKTARDRDKLREAVLRDLGWRLHRVWASDWWHDPEAEIQRLEAAIVAAAEAEEAMEAVEVEVQVAEAQLAEVADVGTPVAAAAVLPEPADDAPALPVYCVSQAIPSAAATELDFFAPGAAPHLQQLIAAVVQDEGPLSLPLLCQRVAPFWGIHRVTGRVEQRVSSLAGNITRALHGDVAFLWPAQLQPEAYQGLRVPTGDEATRRNAADLPPEEVANAALYVLKGQVSLPVEGLVREVARVFGYQRIGQNVDHCLRAGIALAIMRGAAEDRDGMVVLRT
jgi:very-short-patch-repair endonuclease